ncbi:MAG TPA: hypothetical protein VMS93_03380 [Candidatus Saccharimonadales bacterium]|nr:hypothetical protein [Candidatus Saccharimonadales bacterium]
MSAPEPVRPAVEGVPAWAGLLPGFRGYKERELLREDDRAVRSRVADELRRGADALRRISADHLRRGPDELLTATDRLSVQLRAMADAVALAPAGYHGLFDRKAFRQRELDQLLSLDLELLQGVRELAARLAALDAAVAEPGRYMLILQGVQPRVQALRGLLDRRAALLR